jgi:NAD(P)H dehydrogenase (quinone)
MNAAYEAPTADDADWADAIVLGTPSRFGTVCSELKAYIDSLGGLWFQGRLFGKVGAAFSSSGSKHGGNEATILGLYPALAHLGLVIAPLGYGNPALFQGGTPYGATSISGQQSDPPSSIELQVAAFQGERVAGLARKIRHSA